MTEIVIRQPGIAEIEDAPPPEPSEGDCVIRVVRSTVSQTDVHVFNGAYREQHYPRVPGAHAVGFIERCPGRLSPLRRVVVPGVIPCGGCTACAAGRREQCLTPLLRGRHRDGGMREVMTVPAEEPITISESLDPDGAVCVPEVAFALSIVSRAEATGRSPFLVVFGAGFLGIVTALTAREKGLTVILADVVQARLELARSLGVEHVCNPLRDFIGDQVRWITRTRLAETAIVTSEDAEAVLTATSVLRPGGLLLLTGLHTDSQLPVRGVIDNSLRVAGVRRTRERYGEAAAFIRRNREAFQLLISLRLEPESMPQTFALLAQEPKSYMKAICAFD